MQSIFSVAAMTFAAAAMVLAILGLGGCKTPGEGGMTRTGATNAAYAADGSARDRLWTNVRFGLPSLPRPRLPRPRMP